MGSPESGALVGMAPDVEDSCRYIKVVIVTAFALLIAVVILEVAVDPKGLYGIIRIEGFNFRKAFQNNYAPEVKALAVREYRPNTVFVGASTVERGIVAECHDSSIFGDLRIYNSASSGSAPANFLAQYPNLRTIGTVRHLEVETRFPNQRFLLNGEIAFDHSPISRPQKYAPMLIPAENGIIARAIQPWLPSQYAFAYLADLFSWRASILSLETIAANRIKDRAAIIQGYEKNGTFDQSWLRYMAAPILTREIALTHVASYTDFLLVNISNEMTFDFSYVDALAAAAGRDGISLDFFVPPEHVVELLLYDLGGVWPLYERFKLDLLRAVDAARKSYAANIRVFDFGTLNDATEQPLRASISPGAFDPYYGDPVHFRSVVGDFMLSTMLGCPIAASVPDGFGVELNAKNADRHLTVVREMLDRYRDSNIEIVREISNRITDTRGGVH
jgi:hypothetical protein